MLSASGLLPEPSAGTETRRDATGQPVTKAAEARPCACTAETRISGHPIGLEREEIRTLRVQQGDGGGSECGRRLRRIDASRCQCRSPLVWLGGALSSPLVLERGAMPYTYKILPTGRVGYSEFASFVPPPKVVARKLNVLVAAPKAQAQNPSPHARRAGMIDRSPLQNSQGGCRPLRYQNSSSATPTACRSPVLCAA